MAIGVSIGGKRDMNKDRLTAVFIGVKDYGVSPEQVVLLFRSTTNNDS